MHESAKHPLVVRVTDNDFQCEVLEKLARLEAKMEMLVGSTQPGRISLIETKVAALERNDVRRGVYDRLVNARDYHGDQRANRLPRPLVEIDRNYIPSFIECIGPFMKK